MRLWSCPNTTIKIEGKTKYLWNSWNYDRAFSSLVTDTRCSPGPIFPCIEAYWVFLRRWLKFWIKYLRSSLLSLYSTISLGSKKISLMLTLAFNSARLFFEALFNPLEIFIQFVKTVLMKLGLNSSWWDDDASEVMIIAAILWWWSLRGLQELRIRWIMCSTCPLRLLPLSSFSNISHSLCFTALIGQFEFFAMAVCAELTIDR